MFKLPKYRVYNHVPIYYSEEQERQKERERNVREELGLAPDEHDKSTIDSRIRGKMRQRKQSQFNVAYKERKKSNLRLLAIVMILMALAYYMMHSSREWLDMIAK